MAQDLVRSRIVRQEIFGPASLTSARIQLCGRARLGARSRAVRGAPPATRILRAYFFLGAIAAGLAVAAGVSMPPEALAAALRQRSTLLLEIFMSLATSATFLPPLSSVITCAQSILFAA